MSNWENWMIIISLLEKEEKIQLLSAMIANHWMWWKRKICPIWGKWNITNFSTNLIPNIEGCCWCQPNQLEIIKLSTHFQNYSLWTFLEWKLTSVFERSNGTCNDCIDVLINRNEFRETLGEARIIAYSISKAVTLIECHLLSLLSALLRNQIRRNRKQTKCWNDSKGNVRTQSLHFFGKRNKKRKLNHKSF